MNNEHHKDETKLDRAIQGYEILIKQFGKEMADKVLEMNKSLIKEAFEEKQKETK